MTSPKTVSQSLSRLLRRGNSFNDLIGGRPVGLVVFLASALLLIRLVAHDAESIRVDAVTTARLVDHPALATSFVTAVFVESGARVEVGQPLVELSPYFINQRVARLDAEIDESVNKSKLAQASLVVEEQLWLVPGLRARPNRPSLASPTAEFYGKQLEVLQTRRALLLQDRNSLTVRSSFAGRVASVAWLGASITEGASVASIMPDHAEEIVAFLDPWSGPDVVEPGARAQILNPSTQPCGAPAQVLRLGAAVEQAPIQMNGPLLQPVHGTAVHISVPTDCLLGIGQVMSIELSRRGET